MCKYCKRVPGLFGYKPGIIPVPVAAHPGIPIRHTYPGIPGHPDTKQTLELFTDMMHTNREKQKKKSRKYTI